MLTRILSGLVAIAVVVAIYALWTVKGLYAIGLIFCLGAIHEYARLTLRPIGAPLLLKGSFYLGAAAILISTIFFESAALFVFPIASAVFAAMAVISIRKGEELQDAMRIIGAGLVGFVYCGLFPALALKTLEFPSRGMWFLALLAIVFASDTFAYFSGSFFGKTKLLESVSPKKTIEGSIGGLLGAGLIGLCFGFFFADFFFAEEIPLGALFLCALTTAVFSQIGDLFESLLKRLAEVKDSGTIMPGHGGILDRLDGVFFAAPVFYALVRFLLY